MKVRNAAYCVDCKEVFKKAKRCPVCNSEKVVPLVRLWKNLLNLVDVVRGEIRRAMQ